MKLDAGHAAKELWSTACIASGIAGAIYLFWGTIYCVWLAGSRTAGPENAAWGMAIYGSGSIVCALFATSKIKDRRRQQRDLIHEQAILRYVSTQNDRQLTLQEIACQSGLTLSDTSKTLQRMSSFRVCDLIVSDAGRLLYTFEASSPETHMSGANV